MNYTFWGLVFTLVVACFIGWIAQEFQPAAKTFPEAWKMQTKEKRASFSKTKNNILYI